MGIQDFAAMFDSLDLSSEGFISCEKLHEFDEFLHYGPICIQHVHAAVSQICGGDGHGTVRRENFLEVLQELDRRRMVEERAYWDFQALDSNADGQLPLKDALLLFRDSYGENFSMTAWERFLSAREIAEDEVCFDELRMWLCDLPSQYEAPVDKNRLKSEEDKLEELHLTHAMEEYDSAKHSQESAAAKEKSRKDYQDSLRTQAERKQKKWHQEGIEALLFDDGKDVDRVTAVKSRQKIAIKDLYDLLEEKYSHLRQKLIWQMVSVTSEEQFSDIIAGDGIESYHEVEGHVKQLWKSKTLGEKWAELPGSSSHLPFSLMQLMAELQETDAKHKSDVIRRYEELLMEGKSHFQACNILEEQYQEFCKGSQLCGEVMSELFRRYQDEKDALASAVKMWVSQGDATSQISKQYFKLLLQDILICGESSFVPATLACGLGERPQTYRPKRFDWDRVRMEKLAAVFLTASKGRQPRKASRISQPEESSLKKSELELQVDILHQMVEIFIAEREILINMLQGRESVVSKSDAKELSVEQRRGKLNGLRTQRQNLRDGMSSEASESQKANHRKLLQEAVGIAYENRFLDLMAIQPNVTENAVNASLLADLQQKQYVDLYTLIEDIISKDSKELKKLMKTCVRAFAHEHLDTIAFVILGALDVNEEERRFIDTLEEKYQAIRESILLHALRCKHGTSWNSMSKEERLKELRAKKKEEKKLRGEGRWKDMALLLGSAIQEMPSLQTVMGENKADYASRLENDEISPEKLPAINPLADLVLRQETEQNYLLTWLRSSEIKAMTFARRRQGLVKMLLEKLCVEQETDYTCMGYRLGLLERIEAALENRHNADKLRQTKMSSLRCKHRRLRLSHNEIFKKEAVPKGRPTSGNSVGWQMLYLNQVIQRHLEEEETLLQLCQDETLAELQEAAQHMTTEEQQKRLCELSAKRQQLDLENQEDREESLSILEEATAIKMLSRKLHLERQTGEGPVTVDDVTSSLLLEVYLLQDKELAVILQAITDKDEDEVGKLFANEVNARQWEMVENVVSVITKYEGDGSDDQLLQALDEKYDALRDKLLMEALMKQLGESEYLKLSEQERQRRLALLKLQERRLTKEGKIDELTKLLGDHELAEKNLRNLLGENRAEAERHLRERLAERQRRKALGEDLCDDDDTEDDTKEQYNTGNILTDLNKRYEDERDALMASLKGQDKGFWSEKERQAELLRLNRERRQAEREGRFNEAALVLGLAERQQEQLEERLKNDRKRQEILAKSRLEELQKRKGKQKDNIKDEVVKTGNRAALQEAVLTLLERRHLFEQERLYEMLSDKRNEGLRKEAALISGVQRDDRLAELRGKLQQIPTGKIKERIDVLQQGIAVKMESRKCALCQSADQLEVQDTDVGVSLMADLQEEQSMEAERMINSLQDMEDDQLIVLQEEILASRKNEDLECIVKVVFAPERHQKTTEGELLTALEEKYDALRDKLLIDALMKQVGEANWQRLSQQERQRRLMELKLKERKLRQENTMDKLSKILGDDVKNKEALEKLLGESKEDQRRKLQEKLEKRRQRLAEGLSEEQCDHLEKLEDEEEAKKPWNVLLDLQHRLDQEKAELLQRLQDSDSKYAQEQHRQMELVRLKREQRKVHQEEKFESAALILGLARESEERVEKNLHADRERQRRLARERLETRRNRRNDVHVQPTELSTLGDTNDVVFLQDCVSREIEARHQAEREYLMKLFQECEQEPQRSRSEFEINKQMSQLQLLYKNWKGAGGGLVKDKDTLHNILLGGVRVQLEKRLEEKKDPASLDGPQVALLADLQQVQDDEYRMLVSNTAEKDSESLRKIKAVQSVKRSDGHHDNLAVVLLCMSVEQTENDSSDDALLQALDMKYDSFKDKLFMEAAKCKMGKEWWESAQEEDRMRQVSELRLQDQQLREEGRGDEANDVFENFLSTAGLGDLMKRLGEEEANDEERQAEQEKLRQERLDAGMSLDDVLRLEESQEELDGKAERKNILDKLSHSYEDEKAALLASLQSQEDQLARERQRQLEVAKLRRDKRRIQQEEKLDNAAILLHAAHRQETKLKNNLEEQRSRQRALAQNRLAARKQKKQGIAETRLTLEDELREQHHDGLLDDNKVSVEGILQAVERKQAAERDMLLQLLQAVQDDEALKTKVESQTPQDIRKELKAQREKRTKWLMEVQQTKPNEDSVADDKYVHQVVTSRTEQFHLWKMSLALKCEDIVREKLHNSSRTQKGEVWEEVTLDLLADLQDKQDLETEAVEAALLSVQDEGMLDRVKQVQRRSCREGWYISLAEVIFSGLATVEEDNQLQESLQRARSKAKEEGLSAEETESILKDLQAQHESQIQRKNSVRANQERQLQEKLALMRRKKSFQEDTEDAALSVLLMSGAQAEVVQDLNRSEKLRQNSLMQERLAKRRAARKKAAEQNSGEEDSRPSSQDSSQSAIPRQRRGVSVEVTEDEKHATYSQLVRQQSSLYRKISEQQTRQEEMLQRRLEQISSRREEEAAALFSLGERQKSVLEKSKQDERERQVSRVQERVARVRYERTMTKRDRSHSPRSNFDQIKDDEAENMAQNIENKFKEQTPKENSDKLNEGLMTDQSRLDKMKQRRAQKKEKRLTFAPMNE